MSEAGPTRALAPRSLEIVPSGFFAFRTPLLPVGLLVQWSEGLSAPTASDDHLETALTSDHRLLVDRLRALVADRVVREALFVASPSLDDAIGAWLEDPESDRAHGVVEIVARYFARMCVRPTPFGLFSGCSVGALGKDTRMTLAPRAEYERHTRLDTHYLSALCEALEKDPAVRSATRFHPSSGLFRSGGQLRYPESRTDPETRERTFSLVSVESTPYLEETLERAQRGLTPGELARALADADDVPLDEAQGYVDQLIDSQILVSDLAPPVTGREPIYDIVDTLRSVHAAAAERVAGVAGELEAMDRDGLGLGQERYAQVAATLSELPAKAELPRLFQVDLFKPAPGSSFGGAPLREMTRALDVLARFRRETPAHEDTRKFREAFAERYEGREVSLVDALDEERGIGVELGGGSSEPSPLLEDLRFPAVDGPRPPFGAHEDWLLERLARCGREWALDASDLASLEGKTLATPPDAFAVLATLAASSPDALARGELKMWLRAIAGPSGGVLLGRFCHGDDELARLVRAHMRAEEALRPDAIFAEIVHLPEGRLGNILCRPLLREHEIAYLGRSGAPADKQIAVSDLRVSLQGDRVVLRSARLGREIVPRLTSAHNYAMGALGIYRFLCRLQAQDSDADLGWSWGALWRTPYLPRVTLGRTVLSLARWNVRKDELKPLGASRVVDRFRAVQALRRRLELPRWIGLVDGDNVLPVDLENVVQVDSFVSLVKKREMATVQEVFPGHDEMCVSGPEGLFAHEVVVPFVRSKPRPATEGPPRARSAPLARTFVPGSEWLYAKIYAGTATADRVLSEVVAPLVEESLAAGDADTWFFLRYGDPHWHLRVRLHGDPARLAAHVIPRVHRLTAPLVADGRVWRVVLDTYEREIERYGGDEGMLACEAIFRADSDAVLTILGGISGDEAADARWRLALRGMHLLLLDLGLDLERRRAIVSSARASFAAESGVTGELEKQLGAKFRRERHALEGLLETTVEAGVDSPLHAGSVALAERSAKIAAPARVLASLEAIGRLTPPLASIAASLLHMHANRLLRAEQRAHELVLYDILARLYDSEAARDRKR